MKRFLIVCLVVFMWAGIASADRIILDSPEQVDSPTAVSMNWYIDYINAQSKVMQIKYQLVDENDNPIRDANRFNSWHTWQCRNIEVPGTNAECVGLEDPYECCTGEGTGTCDDMISTCFTDVFGFNIRSQDVGTAIGVGLRALIWNQMKNDVLSEGNDGTFQAD